MNIEKFVDSLSYDEKKFLYESLDEYFKLEESVKEESEGRIKLVVWPDLYVDKSVKLKVGTPDGRVLEITRPYNLCPPYLDFSPTNTIYIESSFYSIVEALKAGGYLSDGSSAPIKILDSEGKNRKVYRENFVGKFEEFTIVKPGIAHSLCIDFK